MDKAKGNMVLLATAVGAGVATILVLYFCSQRRENSRHSGTSPTDRGTKAKAKVSIVQPYKQQYTQPNTCESEDTDKMGNSQSDDVITGDSPDSTAPTTSAEHNTSSINKPTKTVLAHTVSYSGQTDKCSVNRGDSVESKEDHTDGLSGAFDSGDQEVTNRTVNNASSPLSGISHKEDKSAGRTVDTQSKIGHTTNEDSPGSISLLQPQDNISVQEVTDKVTVKRKTSSLKSGKNKEIVVETCESDIVSEVHQRSQSERETFNLVDSVNSARENINTNCNTTITTDSTSFSTEVGSHKYTEGNDVSGLKSNLHSKEPGSGSTLPIQSSRKQGNITLSGDLNDKDTTDGKHGSAHKESKDTLNSEGERIDSLSVFVNNNNPQCQTHKSGVFYKGQVNGTGKECKVSSLDNDTKEIKDKTLASGRSGEYSERMDTSDQINLEDRAGAVMDISKVPMRTKRKSPNKRDAFILPEVDVKQTETVIGQWINEQQVLITEKSGLNKEKDGDATGNVFCSQISSDCKVIFSPNLSQKNVPRGMGSSENILLSAEPVKMSEKACQTHVDMGEGQDSGQGQTKGSNQDLENVLKEVKKLREENAKLQGILESRAASEGGETQEENNNIKSVAMKQEVAAASSADLAEQEEEVSEANTSDSTTTATESPADDGETQAEDDNLYTECAEESFDSLQETVLKESLESITDDGVQMNVVQAAGMSDDYKDIIKEAEEEESDMVYSDALDMSPGKDAVELRQDLGGSKTDGVSSKSKKKRESSFFDDLSLSNSPQEASGGFSFDDILKANLEYLSDDDLFAQEDIVQRNNTNMTEQVEKTGSDSPRSEPELIEHADAIEEVESEVESESSVPNEDQVETDLAERSEAIQNANQCRTDTLGKVGESAKVSNSTKFWETKLTTIHRDKTVAGSGENVDIDSNSIENIQKTKLLWEEKQSASPPPEETEVKPSEFSDDRLTESIRQTKMKWAERMTSDQNSGNNSSQRRSLEDLSNGSNGSDLEESLGSASKILQKRMLWEGMNISPNSSFREDSPPKRLTLDCETEIDQKDVGKTKMKWEEMLENKGNSPEPARRAVRLVSKSELELELENMSTNVEIPSISDVSNTKSKFEKMFSSSDDISCMSPERLRRSERRSQSPKQCSNVLFTSLKEKFEGAKKEEVAGQMRIASSLDDVRRLKSQVHVQARDEMSKEQGNGLSNFEFDQSQQAEDDPFLSLVSEGNGGTSDKGITDAYLKNDKFEATDSRKETIESTDLMEDCLNDIGEDGDNAVVPAANDISDDSKPVCDRSDEPVSSVEADDDTTDDDVKVKGSDKTEAVENNQNKGSRVIGGHSNTGEIKDSNEEVSIKESEDGNNSENDGMLNEVKKENIIMDPQYSERSQETTDESENIAHCSEQTDEIVIVETSAPSESQTVHEECEASQTVNTGIDDGDELFVKDFVKETEAVSAEGSSEHFCDSELDFVKNNREKETKVELTEECGSSENISEC